MSNKGKKFPQCFGKNNIHWKGGIDRFPKCEKCGKPLSAYHCKLCSKCNIKYNHPRFKNGKPKCKDCGKILSDYVSKRCPKCYHKSIIGKNNSMFGKAVSSSHFNIYYKTINFRSSWEANFAKWCDGSGIKWEYEPKAFNLGNTTYRPDFYLPEFDCWIEIKGYWRKDAREKVNKFISLNPSINFKLFEKQELQEIGVI